MVFPEILLTGVQVQGYREDVASVLCKSTPDMPNYLLSMPPSAPVTPHSTPPACSMHPAVLSAKWAVQDMYIIFPQSAAAPFCFP